MGKCDYCYFKSVYQDMGASCNCCTLHKDLSKAVSACDKSYKCNSFVSKSLVDAFAKHLAKFICYENGEEFLND